VSEWVVAGISTLLVLGVVAFLLYDAITSPATLPEIRVVVDSVVATRTSFIAHFTAQNLGGSTAAGVRISGVLRAAGDTAAVERSTATLDFVPASSNRRGGLFFTHDPRRYRLTVRAEGFNLP
jgi:uncharacterized protein (TIGR02588 family)